MVYLATLDQVVTLNALATGGVAAGVGVEEGVEVSLFYFLHITSIKFLFIISVDSSEFEHSRTIIFEDVGAATVQALDSCTSQLDVCQCLVVQTPMGNMYRNKPSTSMTHVACESKQRSAARSSMHPCPAK